MLVIGELKYKTLLVLKYLKLPDSVLLATSTSPFRIYLSGFINTMQDLQSIVSVY